MLVLIMKNKLANDSHVDEISKFPSWMNDKAEWSAIELQVDIWNWKLKVGRPIVSFVLTGAALSSTAAPSLICISFA